MGQAFDTKRLPGSLDVVAPDGSDVRVLLQLDRGGMAHFELAAGQVSRAVAHRTVEEIWYVLRGTGEMWRRQDDRQEFVRLEPGICVSIPVGTHFQFRSAGDGPLAAVAITMPPWPGADEAYEVSGVWPVLARGAGVSRCGSGSAPAGGSWRRARSRRWRWGSASRPRSVTCAPSARR